MIKPRLIAQIEGNFSSHLPREWEENGRLVFLKEHPDCANHPSGDQPLFEAHDLGGAQVQIREHGPGDYRVTARWPNGTIAYQTIPCDDLKVVCYLANMLTLSFRISPPQAPAGES